jgi:hypothetical protein
MIPEFKEWPKIPRLYRDIVITEKIDGTNACVYVGEDSTVQAGSRTRWITPESDNHGFAKWVQAHAKELRELEPGYHFGEWWGQGIQRRYGLQEKRFSLFNVHRWGQNRPACCHVVPVLYEGKYSELEILAVLGRLQFDGSVVAPGFDKPEGIVIYHKASGHLYKVTLEGDQKGAAWEI